jgi:hypothetical protein
VNHTPAGDTQKQVSCSVRNCPHGCTVITLGPTSLHLGKADFLGLMQLLLQHARTNGMDVAEDLIPQATTLALH